jgi:hypothetical protein
MFFLYGADFMRIGVSAPMDKSSGSSSSRRAISVFSPKPITGFAMPLLRAPCGRPVAKSDEHAENGKHRAPQLNSHCAAR